MLRLISVRQRLEVRGRQRLQWPRKERFEYHLNGASGLGPPPQVAPTFICVEVQKGRQGALPRFGRRTHCPIVAPLCDRVGLVAFDPCMQVPGFAPGFAYADGWVGSQRETAHSTVSISASEN